MKRMNRGTGTMGEQLAAEYLHRLGFEPILKNFGTRFGEIDLIMKDRDVLVFVEVKTKIGRGFGLPEEMFTRNKYLKVKRMAEAYLNGKKTACRIDMVAVELGEDLATREIRHFENVGADFEK